jgi:putative tryptophan/tyrosine transport system substrate-binding protein
LPLRLWRGPVGSPDLRPGWCPRDDTNTVARGGPRWHGRPLNQWIIFSTSGQYFPRQFFVSFPRKHCHAAYDCQLAAGTFNPQSATASNTWICEFGLMRRRDFIKAMASTATVWPLVGRAQERERRRRIGVLMNLAADDQEGQARLTAFVQALSDLGWQNANNVQIDTCWGAGDTARFHQCATELVALAPDIILAASASTMDPLLNQTRGIPIVFAQVPDPVGSGYVKSLARPGGNVTGFTQFDFSMAGKWLGLLKTIEPNLTRAIVLRDVDTTGAGQFGAIQTAARSMRVEVSPAGVRNTSDIEIAVRDFARNPKGGLIVTGSAPAAVHRDFIIALAARYRLPAIYPFRYFAHSGGLLSYGPTTVDPYIRAAGYVDRILKGEKAANLPVQAPTKYELVINMKTAKALGLELPRTLLADEVIE